MWIILLDILLSATAGLVWCILITFFCMCIEHLLFKRQPRPQLTDKEIILIKEVLAGNISLPLVANDGLFVECVDRIEHIFEAFIKKTESQIVRLDCVSKELAQQQMSVEPLDDNFQLELEIEHFERFKTDEGRSFDDLLERYPLKAE